MEQNTWIMFFHRHLWKWKLRDSRWGVDPAKSWHPWSWCAVPRGWCGSGKRSCREVLPSRDVLTHQDRIHAALFAPVSWEELSWNFPSRCFFSKKYNFWKQGRWCLFCRFNWEKNLPWELEVCVALINKNIFWQMEQHWHFLMSKQQISEYWWEESDYSFMATSH